MLVINFQKVKVKNTSSVIKAKISLSHAVGVQMDKHFFVDDIDIF